MEEAELCFPHLHNTSCRKTKLDPSQTQITNVLLVLASLLTSFLNLIVIIAMAHFRSFYLSLERQT
ncbi:hypothetical protein WMY93_016518 [Mugilogobius chulae]|uniref:Uncharacterized protein n=1 Tax=Mugilogobius chulae TaxID=88201 RepID=A0AAW0NXB9_9GOBI